jgi:hypothetical protein
LYNAVKDEDKYVLVEIAYSNWEFWEFIVFAVLAMLIPVYFIFNLKSLLFPNLKDLIMSGSISYRSVMGILERKEESQKSKANRNSTGLVDFDVKFSERKLLSNK